MGSVKNISAPPQRAPLAEKRFESAEELQRIGHIVREAVLQCYRPDSCVGSTRILIAVLAHYDIRSVQLPVQVAVYNAAFSLGVKRLRQLPREDPLSRARIKRRKGGARAILIGYGSDVPFHAGWDGHLVAWVPNRKIIIDASIDQASRPQHSINLPRCLVLDGADSRFAKGSLPLCAEHDGSVLRYDAAPNNLAYIESPDWNTQSGRRHEIFMDTLERSIAAVNDCYEDRQARHQDDESDLISSLPQ